MKDIKDLKSEIVDLEAEVENLKNTERRYNKLSGI